MLDFGLQFRLGLRPIPRWGSLQHSPRPLAGLKGPTSKGRGGEEGKRGRGEEGKRGRGEKGRERKERGTEVGERKSGRGERGRGKEKKGGKG